MKGKILFLIVVALVTAVITFLAPKESKIEKGYIFKNFGAVPEILVNQEYAVNSAAPYCINCQRESCPLFTSAEKVVITVNKAASGALRIDYFITQNGKCYQLRDYAAGEFFYLLDKYDLDATGVIYVLEPDRIGFTLFVLFALFILTIYFLGLVENKNRS